MKIVIVNGAPRSGKDTIVEMAVKMLGDRVLNVSTVDKVKVIARQCGWLGEKTPEARKFLSQLKDITNEFNDMSFKDVIKKVDSFKKEMIYYRWNSDDCVVFIHSREPEDIQKYVDYYTAKHEEVITLLVRRPLTEIMTYSNHSDNEVENYSYSAFINNAGTLDDLYIAVQDFLLGLKLDIKQKL